MRLVGRENHPEIPSVEVLTFECEYGQVSTQQRANNLHKRAIIIFPRVVSAKEPGELRAGGCRQLFRVAL